MTVLPAEAPRRLDLRIARRLAPSQALYVFGSSVDMTLTGIVGADLAPTRELATLPFSLIPVTTIASTFVVSRAIGRSGYRAVFVAGAFVALLAGATSALAVQLGSFWLFCAGTALIGVYAAGAGYYRYAAADNAGSSRAAAVTTVLAGGLVAAVAGPFLAIWTADLLPTAYAASYLLVALLGALGALWNAALPADLARALHRPDASPASGGIRSRRALWRNPALRAGVAITSFAGITMTIVMTAGPLVGVQAGRTAAEVALGVQMHMIGMFAPGFVVARVIGRTGERAVTMTGVVITLVGGAAAALSTDGWAFVTAMLCAGVGWNLAYSGGSALIAAGYRPAERGRVQPVAEAVTGTFQVAGSFSAGSMATAAGWHAIGVAVAILAAVLGVGLAVRTGRRRTPGASAGVED